MKKEIFKDIPNYEGVYQVSNKGNVRSLDRNVHYKNGVVGRYKGKDLKPLINDGYLKVTLCKGGKLKSHCIHTLVTMTFLNHIPNGHNIVIDHIDNNPLNNNLTNLQLITQRENCSKDKKGYSSKYVGVCWDSSKSKWKAQIIINGKNKHIGNFSNEIDAHNAYQNKLSTLTN